MAVNYSTMYVSLLCASAVILLALTVNYSLHKVEEGHVAVYYRGGALLQSVAPPGLHLMIPFLTSLQTVQITLRTDKLTDVPCDTVDGVTVCFDQVEIVHILDERAVYSIVKNFTTNYNRPFIFDKVIHELKLFCATRTLQEIYNDLFNVTGNNLKKVLQRDLMVMAPGLRVHAVRVMKPKIPEILQIHNDLLEQEKTKLLIVEQKQKVVKKEGEIEMMKALLEAETQAEVAKIQCQQQILEKEMQKRISEIEDEIVSARAKSRADAEFYASIREAEANKLKLTAEFLEYERVQAVSSIEKVYYGRSIRKMLFDTNDKEWKQLNQSVRPNSERKKILYHFL